MRQAQALQVMMSGASVFVTGAPGSGKTYLLHQFIHRARQAGKNVAVTASTGIAATHVNGTTIHSWSGLGIRDSLSQYDIEKIKNNSKLIKRYNATDVLIIDEVSMLHGARLDMLSLLAQTVRKNNAPFGGIQVVLVGDLFQLPPVTRGTRDMADFVHLSSAWDALNPHICYLTEQHRVNEGDTLLDLLEAMRRGDVNELHEQAIRERLMQPTPIGTVITKLYSHNVDVDSINQHHLALLKSPTHRYEMQTKGSAAIREQLIKGVLAPEILELKIGAEVMFVANNFASGFVNGTRGTVIGFTGDDRPVVVVAGGKEIIVEPHSWRIDDDGATRAEVTQLPIRLAWAITIHKSQGMSLDAAEIDLSRSFTPGMGYVALSRVRRMDGVYLRGINHMALQLHPLIFDFDTELRQMSKLLADETDDFTEKKAGEQPLAAEDTELFEKLRGWRRARAAKDRVSAYIILHDKTLHELATRRPQTEQALKAINGFGPMKASKYGTELLELLNNK